MPKAEARLKSYGNRVAIAFGLVLLATTAFSENKKSDLHFDLARRFDILAVNGPSLPWKTKAFSDEVLGIRLGTSKFKDVVHLFGDSAQYAFGSTSGVGSYVCYRTGDGSNDYLVAFLGQSLIDRETVDGLAITTLDAAPESVDLCPRTHFSTPFEPLVHGIQIGMSEVDFKRTLGRYSYRKPGSVLVARYVARGKDVEKDVREVGGERAAMIGATFEKGNLRMIRLWSGVRF